MSSPDEQFDVNVYEDISYCKKCNTFVPQIYHNLLSGVTKRTCLDCNKVAHILTVPKYKHVEELYDFKRRVEGRSITDDEILDFVKDGWKVARSGFVPVDPFLSLPESPK